MSFSQLGADWMREIPHPFFFVLFVMVFLRGICAPCSPPTKRGRGGEAINPCPIPFDSMDRDGSDRPPQCGKMQCRLSPSADASRANQKPETHCFSMVRGKRRRQHHAIDPRQHRRSGCQTLPARIVPRISGGQYFARRKSPRPLWFRCGFPYGEENRTGPIKKQMIFFGEHYLSQTFV